MPRGYVISDLHMMAAYSHAEKYWHAIDNAAAKADFFVLNGDLNEMYFSNLPFEQRLDTAIGNIERLARAHPKCQFHYVIGNHENIDAYMTAIMGLAHRLPNLEVHPSLYRMGNALFLHGDEPLSHGQISWQRHLHSAGGLKQQAAGNILPLVNPFQAKYRDLRHAVRYSFNRDVGRVLSALDKAEPVIKDGVEHVFFAHTHRPKMAVAPKHTNIKFYNTGAGVRGARFCMLEIETDDKQHVAHVQPVHTPAGIGERLATSPQFARGL